MAESVKWAAPKKKAVLDWIDVELRQALGDRQALEKKWRDWLESYRAFATQPTRSFPFEGASNVVLPVTATDVDQLYANFITTIHEPENLWTVTPKNIQWNDAAKPAQDFLTLLDHVVDMYKVDGRVVMEMCKLGTGIYKHGWTFERRGIRTYDKAGNVVRMQKITSRPFVDYVRCFDFILPTYSYEVQPDQQGGAPWVAERTRMSIERFSMLAGSSDPHRPNINPDDVKKVIAQHTSHPTEWDDKVRQLDYDKRGVQTQNFDTSSDTDATTRGTGQLIQREVEIYEIHARCQTDGDEYNDVILWYHLPTRTIIRSIYNDYDHGQRPYEVIRYFPGEGFWGIGVCEQKELFQRIQSELLNHQMDNVLLGNTVMMVAKSGANIVPGEPIYPGKIFFTDGDVRNDFASFKMADINQTLPQLHEMWRNYGERRTGVSEINLGQISALPGRTPATSVLAMQAEGKKRPDLTLKDMRHEGLAKVGLRLIQLCQQYLGKPSLNGPALMEIALQSLGAPYGQRLMEKLMLPMENAELGLGVELTATSAVANKEVQKQTYMGLLQLTAQLAPVHVQLMQVALQAQMANMAPLASIALTDINAMSQLYIKLLEQNDIRTAEQLAPKVSQASPDVGIPDPTLVAPQPDALAGGVPGQFDQGAAMGGVPGGIGAPV